MWPGIPHILASSWKRLTAQRHFDTHTHTRNGEIAGRERFGGSWVDPCSCENLCSPPPSHVVALSIEGFVVWIFGYTAFLIVWDLVWFSFFALFFRDGVRQWQIWSHARMLTYSSLFPFLSAFSAFSRFHTKVSPLLCLTTLVGCHLF